MQGEGVEWRARVRSGGSPSAGAVGLEFPSKGVRRSFGVPFEGNSKGTRRVMEPLRASCRAHPATISQRYRERLRVPFEGI